MTPGLAHRIEDIPGVASVAVDLTESGGGINVRLEPGADETAVMERVRGLIAAYGARVEERASEDFRGRLPEIPVSDSAVEVLITPLSEGARVEVSGANVRSFRVVAAAPTALAQGLADAWCQVIGRVPVEVVRVGKTADAIEVAVTDGKSETVGTGSLQHGWERAFAIAVGGALNAPLRAKRTTLTRS